MKLRLKKSLSMLLSILMIMTTISVVFSIPTFAAASSKGDVMNVLNKIPVAERAVNSGFRLRAGSTLHTDTYTNNATYSYSLDDLTTDGLFYDAAKAMAEYINATSNITADKPMSWWSSYYARFVDDKPALQPMIRALLDMASDTSFNVSRVAPFDAAFSLKEDGSQSWNTASGTQSTPPKVSISVYRTELQALRNGKYNYSNLPDSVNTVYTYNNNSTARGSKGGYGTIGLSTRYYNRFNAKLVITEGTPLNTLINKIKAYSSYFTPAVLATDLYNTAQYNIVATNIAALRNNLNEIPEAERSTYVKDYEAIKAFIAKFDSIPAFASGYLANINYFQAANGFIDKINAHDYNSTDLATVEAMWNDQAYHYGRISALTSFQQAKLVEVYGLNLTSINATRSVLLDEYSVLKLPNLKQSLDSLYNQYANPSNDYRDATTYPSDLLQVIENQMRLDINLVNIMPASAVSAIFPDGTAYFRDFYQAVKFELAFRNVTPTNNSYRDFYYDAYYANYSDRSTEDVLDKLVKANEKLPEYLAAASYAQSVLSSTDYEVLYNSFTNSIVYNSIERLSNILVSRFENQVAAAKKAFNDSPYNGTMTWDNFAIVRSLINMIDSVSYDYLVTKLNSSYISQSSRADYLWLKSTVIDAYDTFIKNGGYNTFVAANPTYLSRVSPIAGDLARSLGMDYNVTEAGLLNVITSLDNIITSKEFTDLTGMDLSNMITDLTSCMCSDQMVNCIVMTLYPAVIDAFEDAWADLPTSYAITERADIKVIGTIAANVRGTLPITVYNLHDVLNNTNSTNTINNLAVYPDLLAKLLPSNFADVKTQLTNAVAGIDWTVYNDPNGAGNDKRPNAWAKLDTLLADGKTPGSDGKLDINWGVDNPTDTAMKAMTKNERFQFALSNALKGVYPLVAAILIGKDYSGHADRAASISGQLYSDCGAIGNPTLAINSVYLDLTATGNDGYAKVFTPIFEALLGETSHSTIPTAAALRAYSSTDPTALIKAITDPIIEFLKQLKTMPISKIVEILPTAAAAMSLDKVAPLLNELATGIKYVPEGTVTSSNSLVVSQFPTLTKVTDLTGAIFLNVGDLLLGDPESAPIDLSLTQDFNSLIQMLPGCLAGSDCNTSVTLPAFNAACIAALGTMKVTNSPATKRVAGVGNWKYRYDKGTKNLVQDYQIAPAACDATRHYILADKADVMYSILDYFISGISQDPAMMKSIMSLIGMGEEESTTPPVYPPTEPEVIPEACTVIENLASTPTNKGNSIAAVVELFNQKEYPKPEYTWAEPVDADFGYLAYNNGWTRTKADSLYNSLDEIVADVLKMTGQEGSIQDIINDALAGVFTNDTIKSITDAVGTLELDDTILGLVNSLGADLSKWNKYNATFTMDPEEVKLLSEEEIDALQESFYYYDFEDGNRDAFLSAIYEILDPIAPILEFILNGKDISIFANGLKFIGADGYADAVIPILEMLGCKNITAPADYKTSNVLSAIIDPIFARVDDLIASPVETIVAMLPNILYFLYNNNLPTAINILLHPLFVILDTVRPLYPVGFDTILGLIPEDTELPFDISGISQISDISTDFIINVIKELTGLDISGALSTVFAGLLTALEPVTFKNAKPAYMVDLSGGDVITIVVSFLFEIINDGRNQEKIAEMLKIDDAILPTLLSVINTRAAEVQTINWFYFDQSIDKDNAFQNPQNIVVPQSNQSLVYLTYPNNWTRDTKDYLANNLDAIIADVMSYVSPDSGSIADILAGAFTLNDLYNDDIFNSLLDMIQGILKDTIGEDILSAIDVTLDVDLSFWANHDGNWGVTDRASFIAALTDALTTIRPILDWLLSGKSISYFNDKNSSDLISIEGTRGYAYGLVPILEALGVFGLIDADVFDNAETPMNVRVAGVFNPILDRVEAVLADPVNEIIDMIPNLIYFINADGLTVSLNNLLGSVYAIADKVGPLLVDEGETFDIEELIGFPIKNLSFANILNFAGEELGISFAPIVTFLENFWLGDINYFDSAAGDLGFRMDYTTTQNFGDVLTIIVSLVFQVLEYEDNKDALIDLLGDDGEAIYAVISNILNLDKFAFSMQPINWLFTESDRGAVNNPAVVISAIQTSNLFTYGYGKYWTREHAEYIANRSGTFIDNLIHLLGIEIEGVKVDDLEKLITEFVGTTVYSTDILESIYGAVLDLVDQLNGLQGNAHIKALLKDSLGVDLSSWDDLDPADYTIPLGDKAAFVDALNSLLAPIEPILGWLLTKEDYSFFVDEEGKNYVKLNGAEGYAYGIIPLLEALRCDPATIKTPAEFAADKGNMIKNIIVPLLDRVDQILADPVEEVMGMLPGLIYFVNSNGLDASFKNLLHPIYVLLNAVEPLVKVDLYELIGVDLSAYNFDTILALLLDTLSESTGYDFAPLVMDEIAELSLGSVRSFTSKNGQTAYTMDYASKADEADMITIVLRVGMRFLTLEENGKKLKGLLKDSGFISDEAFMYVATLIDGFVHYASTPEGMDAVLGSLFYVAFAVDIATDELTHVYDDITKNWKFIFDILGQSDSGALKNLYNSLVDFMKGYLTDDVAHPDGPAKNGLIKFFEKIAEFFQNIINFFKNLFS